MDDCSDRIGRLEDEDGFFYNAIPAEIETRAEELSDPQVRVWGLLSIARLVRLGERLTRLPGCEVLGQLDWAVDLMFHSLQTLPSQEAYQHLMDMCNALYELNGKPVYYSGEIEVTGRVPFQLFNLNGPFGVEQELRIKARQEQCRKLCGNCYTESDYVYVNDLGVPYKPNFVSQHFKALLEKNKLRPIRFHDLRHPNIKPKTQIFCLYQCNG